MATERELGLRVEDFMGVNSQVSSEDLQDQFYKKLQNIYERKIGEVERIPGSTLLTNTAAPSTITNFAGAHSFYDPHYGKKSIAKVTCSTSGYVAGGSTILSNSSVLTGFGFFTDAVNGKWGTSSVGITNAFIGCTQIQLVAHGWGYLVNWGNPLTAGLPVSGDTKYLSIACTGWNPNITAISVMAQVIVGYDGASPVFEWNWVGYIDCLANPNGGTFNFYYGTITLGADPGAPQSVGTTATVISSPTYGNGSLKGGKTYYVAVMNQRFVYASNPTASTSTYSVWWTDAIQTITVPEGSSAITISKTSGGSAASLVAIGTNPQNLQPIGIVSQAASWSYTITDLPKRCPVNVHMTWTGSSAREWTFRAPDHRREEMLAYIENDQWVPIFISFNTTYNIRISPIVTSISTFQWWDSTSGGLGTSTNATFYFTNFSSGANPLFLFTSKGTMLTTRGTHNIMQSSGFSASYIVPNYNTASPPYSNFITTFKESVVVGGGPGDRYNKCSFTAAYDPYNWGLAASPTTLQFFQTEADGEPVNGLGIYSNTQSTSGPLSQLIVTKANATFILTDLPTTANTVISALSRKVGCANHNTIVNTDIGTIMTSHDGVWLIRDSGEPTPIGHEIAKFLQKESTPATKSDSSQWSACYHDGRYKLAYKTPDGYYELWLNINKMKLMKGQPCWEGPHTGRNIQYTQTLRSFDTFDAVDSQTDRRIAIDVANFRWYNADDYTSVTHFGTNMACELETRDYPLGDPNTNKLHTMVYWKMKAESDFTFSETTTALNENGEVAETLSRSVTKIPGYSSSDFAHFVSSCRAKVYPYYPTGRTIRGETIRKKWSYTGDKLFSITGFTIFYSIEGRRI